MASTATGCNRAKVSREATVIHGKIMSLNPSKQRRVSGERTVLSRIPILATTVQLKRVLLGKRSNNLSAEERRTAIPVLVKISSQKAFKQTRGTTGQSQLSARITNEVGTTASYTFSATSAMELGKEWVSNIVPILSRIMERRSFQNLTITIERSYPSKTGWK